MIRYFETLFRYQSWANAELVQKLDMLDPERDAAALTKARDLLGHSYAVAQIFSAHLRGVAHGYVSDMLEETPILHKLSQAIAASDQWYRDYVTSVSIDDLSDIVAFTFTDGDRGSMSKGEMLIHVALHGGYHRGEIGRILWAIDKTPPWDTFAVHLHQGEPERRLAPLLPSAG